MATKKKGSKKKSSAATENEAPKIITAKGGMSQSQLLDATLAMMEQENYIPKKAGRDFVESLKAVVAQEVGKGNPVNLFGLVKVSPRFHTKGQREVNETFGDPESKKVTKKYPAKVSIKATVFKIVKDSLPGAAKMSKAVGR